MLYIKLIINQTKRQIEANSDCPEHNGTDINRPVWSGFHYTTNATTTTQKQSDYRVEQSFFTTIALFDSKMVVVVVVSGLMETRLMRTSRHFNCLPKIVQIVCRKSKHDAVFLLSVYTRLT